MELSTQLLDWNCISCCQPFANAGTYDDVLFAFSMHGTPKKILGLAAAFSRCPFGMPCHIAVSLPRGDSFLTRCLLTRPSASPGYACAYLAGYACAYLAGARDENGRKTYQSFPFLFFITENESGSRIARYRNGNEI